MSVIHHCFATATAVATIATLATTLTCVLVSCIHRQIRRRRMASTSSLADPSGSPPPPAPAPAKGNAGAKPSNTKPIYQLCNKQLPSGFCQGQLVSTDAAVCHRHSPPVKYPQAVAVLSAVKRQHRLTNDVSGVSDEVKKDATDLWKTYQKAQAYASQEQPVGTTGYTPNFVQVFEGAVDMKVQLTPEQQGIYIALRRHRLTAAQEHLLVLEAATRNVKELIAEEQAWAIENLADDIQALAVAE